MCRNLLKFKFFFTSPGLKPELIFPRLAAAHSVYDDESGVERQKEAVAAWNPFPGQDGKAAERPGIATLACTIGSLLNSFTCVCSEAHI